MLIFYESNILLSLSGICGLVLIKKIPAFERFHTKNLLS